MSKIYSAAELAQVATDPVEVNKKLTDIMSHASESASQGRRSVNYIINETDPLYKPVIERLGRLGFELTYYPVNQLTRHGYLTIEW